MKDVDTLYQKPWPEEESVEIDVFQTRQSEIANHKKIYDKHVRSVLKKNDADDKLFESIVKEFRTMITNYEQLLEKYITSLGSFSNLAELQGYLRKTKEAYNILTERMVLDIMFLNRNEQISRRFCEALYYGNRRVAKAEPKFRE